MQPPVYYHYTYFKCEYKLLQLVQNYLTTSNTSIYLSARKNSQLFSFLWCLYQKCISLQFLREARCAKDVLFQGEITIFRGSAQPKHWLCTYILKVSTQRNEIRYRGKENVPASWIWKHRKEVEVKPHIAIQKLILMDMHISYY